MFLIRTGSNTGRSASRMTAVRRRSCGDRCRHYTPTGQANCWRRHANEQRSWRFPAVFRWESEDCSCCNWWSTTTTAYSYSGNSRVVYQRFRRAVQLKSVSWSCSHRPSHARSTIFQPSYWRSWSTYLFHIWLLWSMLHYAKDTCLLNINMP